MGASPTRQPLQPEAIGAGIEETKCLKPSISGSRIGDRASVQAATRNAPAGGDRGGGAGQLKTIDLSSLNVCNRVLNAKS